MRKKPPTCWKGYRNYLRLIPSRGFVDAILELKGDKVFSIVLFASMAKGNYTKYSDYDLLIIVCQEEPSFKDRLYEYSTPSDGWVETLVYKREPTPPNAGLHERRRNDL